MFDPFDYLLSRVSQILGYDLTPLSPWVASLAPMTIALLIFLYKMRARFQDLDAISKKVESSAEVVSEKTQREVAVVIEKFEKLHKGLEARVAEGFAEMRVFLKPKDEITEIPKDSDVEQEEPTPAKPRQTRLTLATQVRDAVVAKWLEGGWLKPTATDANNYSFEGNNKAGQEITILLSTPYRDTHGTDGRLDFALDLWVDGYKKLNFEWNSQGAYALRGYKTGDWFEDVAYWNFTPAVAETARVA